MLCGADCLALELNALRSDEPNPSVKAANFLDKDPLGAGGAGGIAGAADAMYMKVGAEEAIGGPLCIVWAWKLSV
jgi:hypothetical protein